MVAVREDFRLVRQVRAATIDQIDARQPVLLGDFLRAEVLLDRQRIVRPAFDRRVVADDHHLLARDAPDTRDDPRARNLALVHVARGELADLEEWRAGIEQPLDAVAGQKLAARHVTFAVLFGAALCRVRNIGAQFFGKRAVVLRARAELFVVRNDFTVDPRCAHAFGRARWSKSPAARLAAAAGVGKALGRKVYRMKRSALWLLAPALALAACNT